MNSIIAYKQELKDLLNVSTEELDKMFKSTLYTFKAQMENIGGGDFLSSLMKLSYDQMVIYDKHTDCVDDIQSSNNIADINIKETANVDKCFMCLCGKSHLHNLHIFNHNDCEQKLVIGSTCIKQVEKLKDAYIENAELCQKLDVIITSLKSNEKLLTHKPCYKCGDLVIKKNYQYQKPHMMNYCKDCLCGKDKNFIHCSTCHIKVIPASQPINSWTQGKFKIDCGRCWYQKNKHQSWMKNRN
jgi:hypothetical protein